MSIGESGPNSGTASSTRRLGAAVLGLLHYPLESNVPVACGGAGPRGRRFSTTRLNFSMRRRLSSSRSISVSVMGTCVICGM